MKVKEPEATAVALELLRDQCQLLVRVLPVAASTTVKKDPIWTLLPVPGRRPRAEFHGNASMSTMLTITMIGKGDSDGPTYSPVITVFDKPGLFRWRGKMMADFLFTNDKVFELVKSEFVTRVIDKELFKGLMVLMFWGKLNESVPSMLDSINAALKEKVEG